MNSRNTQQVIRRRGTKQDISLPLWTPEQDFSLTSSTNQHAGESRILPVDIVSFMSTFLDLKSVHSLLLTSTTNITNITKSSTAETRTQNQQQVVTEAIQKAHLKHNLIYVLDTYTHRKSLLIERMNAWLNANPDWKEMYDHPKQHGIVTKLDETIFNRAFRDISTAIISNVPVVVKHLIEDRGVDVNTTIRQNGNNSTSHHDCPLSIALFDSNYPSLSMLQYLLSVDGIDVNRVQLEGGNITLLHYVMMLHRTRCTPDKLRLLLTHRDIDVNRQSSNGQTALHWHVSRFESLCYRSIVTASEVETVKVLLEAGADINIRTFHTQQTAYDILSLASTSSNFIEPNVAIERARRQILDLMDIGKNFLFYKFCIAVLFRAIATPVDIGLECGFVYLLLPRVCIGIVIEAIAIGTWELGFNLFKFTPRFLIAKTILSMNYRAETSFLPNIPVYYAALFFCHCLVYKMTAVLARVLVEFKNDRFEWTTFVMCIVIFLSVRLAVYIQEDT